MGLLYRTFRNSSERRDFGAGSDRIPGPTEGARTFSGPTVTEDTSLAHIDVYKCVSLIADTVAMIPFRAHRHKPSRGEDGAVRMHAEKIPRQPQILTDPMPADLTSEFSFKHRVMSSLLLDGNTYNEINAVNELGQPTVITPIHPSKVRKAYLDDRGRAVYEMHDGGILGAYRDGGTMVHWPGFIRAGALQGVSPIRAGMQGIALSMAAEEFGARWFGDGAHPSGYLHNDNDVDEAEAKAVKAKWVQTFGGLSREPAYLYGGLKWAPIQVNPEESQFIETRRMQTGQIASLYRIPPHLVGDVEKTTSWGTGIEEQGLGFVVYTLGSWVTRLEQAMSLLLPRGQFVKGNVAALLRGRLKDSYEAYAIGRQWGWLSVNDIREELDKPPVEGGDTYLQPMNMVDASKALEAMAAAPADDEGEDDDANPFGA